MMLEEAIDHYIRDDVNQLFPLIMKARDQTKATHQDIRKALAHFRSDHTEVTTIANDLQRMTRKFSEITGITVEFQATQAIPPVTTEVHAQLLRIVQEGLTNAIQHGKATEVSILLTLYRNHIHLVIEDNGRGAVQIKEGIGLTGMRERLALIGGSMSIVNSIGEFKLIIELPLSQTTEEENEYRITVKNGTEHE
jgi:signal transduction histidine kinase